MGSPASPPEAGSQLHSHKKKTQQQKKNHPVEILFPIIDPTLGSSSYKTPCPCRTLSGPPSENQSSSSCYSRPCSVHTGTSNSRNLPPCKSIQSATCNPRSMCTPHLCSSHQNSIRSSLRTTCDELTKLLVFYTLNL